MCVFVCVCICDDKRGCWKFESAEDTGWALGKWYECMLEVLKN